MKCHTLSIVVGNAGCNASCPFCVGALTPQHNVNIKDQYRLKHIRFDKSCRMARDFGATTALLTSKGEPTLHPKLILMYVEQIFKKEYFPCVELQTNGMLFEKQSEIFDDHLRDWYQFGLNTIAISICHYERNFNQKIYDPNGDYIDLTALIKKLHDFDFTVRLACVGIRGGIDTVTELDKLREFAIENQVEQLTWRPVTLNDSPGNVGIASWIEENKIGWGNLEAINNYFNFDKRHIGITKLLEYDYGATIYDWSGQNFCLTNCMTPPKGDSLRQLIYFPDGHLRYDWNYKGAILL